MLRVFLNPGHAPDGIPDPGASNLVTGLRECDVAKNIADLVEKYLVAAGVEVVGNLQSDRLVKFRNGYSANSRSFVADVRLEVGLGNQQWGAKEGERYLVLKIVKIMDEGAGGCDEK